MVQDQLYLRFGQRSGRADQRGRGVQRHPLGRHMGRHRAAHRLHRQRRGAAAVLAEHTGPVHFLHPIGHGGRRVRQRHRRSGAGLPAQIRPDRGRRGGAEHMDRAVRSVPQHPVRQRHPQRIPGHRSAGGCKRTERAAGAVLAQDRPHGVFQTEFHHGGRQIRRGHHRRR